MPDDTALNRIKAAIAAEQIQALQTQIYEIKNHMTTEMLRWTNLWTDMQLQINQLQDSVSALFDRK